MSNTVLLLLRLIHVGSGVLWAGAVLFSAWFLGPAVRASGPAGGQVMMNLAKSTRWPTVAGASGGLAVLSGIILYWDRWLPAMSTPPGIGFMIGGLTGLLALIVGGAIVGRTSGELAKLGAAIETGGAPPTAEQSAQLAAYQARIATGTNIVAILVSIAVIMMAISRYLVF